MKRVIAIILSASAFFSQLKAAEWAPDPEWQGAWTIGTDIGIPGGFRKWLPGQAEERPIVANVIDFGADPTGVVDSEPAFEAAIDAAEALGGNNAVYVPAGTYRLDSTVSLSSTEDNISLRGAGPDQTIIMWNGGATAVFGLFGSSMGTWSSTERSGVTATLGSKVLNIGDTSNYVAGRLVNVTVEDEQDNADIIAGIPPYGWNPLGFDYSRRFHTIIESVDSASQITLKHPFPWIPSDYDIKTITTSVSGSSFCRGSGIESMSVDVAGGATHYTMAVHIQYARECYVWNMTAEWSRDGDNYYPFNFYEAFDCHVEKCLVNGAVPSSSDGAVHISRASGCVIVNNIFNEMELGIYSSGSLCHTVQGYNFSRNEVLQTKGMLIGHGASNGAHNLYEGNSTYKFQADSYHGAVTYITFFRNWWRGVDPDTGLYTGSTWTGAAGRFSRKFLFAGNVVGWDDYIKNAHSWGNPNLGSGYARGFAGPTGAADPILIGNLYYDQAGLPSPYALQASDVSVGDFWNDWNASTGDPTYAGVVTARASDTECQITFPTSTTPDRSTQNSLTIRWIDPGDGSDKAWTTLDIVSWTGDVATVTETGNTFGVAPPIGVAVEWWGGQQGFQERDLDVYPSMEFVHEYYAENPGPGAIVNDLGVDTLPASLAYTSKPDWWNDDGYAGPWPPFDPDNPPTGAYAYQTTIPAAARFFNLTEVGPPADYTGKLKYNQSGRPLKTNKQGTKGLKFVE